MCKKGSDSNRMLLFLFAISLFAFAGSANAFPTWIGVYGDYQHHNGVNPGIYTVLMNQDYYGLHAEVGIQVNSNGYGTYAMSYIGSDSGNSVWQFEVPVAYASNDYVQFYFHGWDDWGGNIYDNNSGWNYSYYAGAAELDWVGNTTQYPTNGAFYAGEDLWVNSESWPRSSGKSGFVLYAQGTNWQGISLSYAGTSGENDWWHQQIGRFSASSTVSYVVGIKDEAGITSYDNNNGSNYSTVVRAGNPMQWAGDVYHWPTNGALTCTNDLWLNLEAWPSNTLVRGYALYSINGFIWWSEPLSFDQIIDNNEAWHVNLGLIPPAVDVRYLFELEDGKGIWHLLPSNDVPFSATVNTTGTDSDSDGLPDDWEQFWFDDLSASPHNNNDNDGVSGLPLDDRLEYLFGTDPAVSNASETLRLLWFPSDPFKGGWIRLSAYVATNEAIYDTGLTVDLQQDAVTWSTNLLADGERFAVSLPLGTNGTSLKLLRLIGNDATNDNYTIHWSVPLRDLAIGETADSDGDGLPDEWEVLYSLDPLDNGCNNAANGAGGDPDGDDISNLIEFQNQLNPRNSNEYPTIEIIYPLNGSVL